MYLYEADILQVLHEAGRRGLTVKKIARHVYNRHNALFETVAFEVVHKRVDYYLRYGCQRKKPIVEHTDKWGTYRLKHGRRSAQAVKAATAKPEALPLPFAPEAPPPAPEPQKDDGLLPLF